MNFLKENISDQIPFYPFFYTNYSTGDGISDMDSILFTKQ